ncbi:C4-dicarboxylate ABC transporter substrate-binding protein [Skermanella stibiiresistens SB22]|uniref:C4-dicarboxylate ABC transporter substrate-binding protein n=1 Tax=Skermanella stibiiresistens SB22 TaxID=1385369 RepID=W9H3Q6_9PROT|nr:TRAP transporter substrate-binding protein [Skermanella stibiiresistens]EWY39362.1 C4-dicarboxylate ABC transporter substrate-binding protein [Skermanella stibiiresistens SB22]
MKMTRWVSTAMALALASLLPSANPTLAATTLQMGHPTASNSHYGVASATLAEELARRSNGKFKLVITPNGAEREMVESAQIGTLDLLVTSTGPVGNFVPEVAIVDIPFLFKDYTHARAVLDGPVGQDMLKLFPDKGLVALAWGENGFRHITNSKHAINTPADAKGLKVRTMENQVHMTAFRQLGVLPTPMAFTEVFTALQQGTVDGQENPIPVITASKFAQVQKYLTLTGHVYSPALILMSKSTFDGLTPEEQQMFRDSAMVAAKAMREKVAAVEATGVAELRAAGMEVITDVDRSKFQEALQPAYAEYAKKFGKENIERIRDYAP